jgi:DNA topoisomerase-3
MVEGKTSPPGPISESDLISEMDKNGIGTDATIAAHISTIVSREYVTKDLQNRFEPTKLGLALVEGYNNMGYQLNKPNLRAAIEKDCQRIVKGELTKEEVLKRNLDQMKVCFVTCNSEAEKLDTAMEKYFPVLGAGNDEDYTILQPNFSLCGICQSLMNIRSKLTQDGNSESPSKFLHCSTCIKALIIPSKGDLSPSIQFCPICKFQVL